MGKAPKLDQADRGFAPFDRADIEASIPGIFERQVRAGPHRTAVAGGSQMLSYDGLNRQSNRIAHAILRRRGDAEEPVALLFRQGSAAVAATLGSLKAGKIYVPLEPTQPAPELQRVIADCQPSLIITDGANEALAKALEGDTNRRMNVETMTAGLSEDDPGLRLSPDRVGYIFYTSGTTGPPKGVFDNHRNVLHNVMRYTNSLEIRATDRLSLIESCSYSGTVSSLFSALLNGAAICPFDLQGQGIERLGAWMERVGVTIFHSVPTIFEQLMATGRGFDDLRLIRLEGDRAERRQLALFQVRFGAGCVLVNGLGTTETGLVRQYFVTPNSKLDGDVVPIGHAVEDMEINVVDGDGRTVEEGCVGEIAVRSAYLACGYWQRPDLTETAFVVDPVDPILRTYRTGDLGRMRAGDCLDFLGRKDFRTKLRGHWIETAEIENALCEIESVSQALVLVRDDGSGAQQLVAYLVSAGASPSVDGIRRRLGQALPAILIPSRYVFLDAMPLDRNGKINQRGLPAPGHERPDLEERFVPPQTNEEEIVTACFCEVLKLDRVGRHDDFLDLGGDSLLATELLLLIEERLNVACPANLITRTFSVASIISGLGQENSESALVRIQDGDDRPPLICICNLPGQILDYYRLAEYLDPHLTVYCVQGRAFTTAGQRDVTVEDLAAAHVAEIVALQSDGPYHLCGNCFDGAVAFEVAQQLRRHGHEVATLALIDTAFPPDLPGPLARRVRSEWQALAKLAVRDWPLHLASRLGAFTARLALVGKRRVSLASERVPGRSTGAPNARSKDILDRNLRAESRYRPSRYDGAFVLICAGPPHDQQGWIGVADGRCRIIELPLDGQPTEAPHLTREPYVGAVAAHISEAMAI
jgi:amino acid adenylation domain-containing protein